MSGVPASGVVGSGLTSVTSSPAVGCFGLAFRKPNKPLRAGFAGSATVGSTRAEPSGSAAPAASGTAASAADASPAGASSDVVETSALSSAAAAGSPPLPVGAAPHPASTNAVPNPMASCLIPDPVMFAPLRSDLCPARHRVPGLTALPLWALSHPAGLCICAIARQCNRWRRPRKGRPWQPAIFGLTTGQGKARFPACTIFQNQSRRAMGMVRRMSGRVVDCGGLENR